MNTTRKPRRRRRSPQNPILTFVQEFMDRLAKAYSPNATLSEVEPLPLSKDQGNTIPLGTIAKQEHVVSRRLYTLLRWLCEQIGEIPNRITVHGVYAQLCELISKKIDLVNHLLADELDRCFLKGKNICGAFMVDKGWRIYLVVTPQPVIIGRPVLISLQ